MPRSRSNRFNGWGWLLLALLVGGSDVVAARGRTRRAAAKRAAEPVVLADALAGARSLQSDRRNLYLLVNDAVVRLPKSGGAPVELAAAEEPFDLTLQRGRLYWTEPSTGLLRSVRADGGEATTLIDERKRPRWVTSDAYALYWVEEDGDQPIVFTMRRGARRSPPGEVLHPFARPLELEASGAHLYWTDHDGGVLHVSKFGGAPERLYQDRLAPSGRLALDGRYVFWTNPTAKTLMRKARSGGRSTVLARDEVNPGAVSVDGAYVYWVSNDHERASHRILRTPKRGGKTRVVAARERPIVELLAEGGWVYWIEEDQPGRAVMKVKP